MMIIKYLYLNFCLMTKLALIIGFLVLILIWINLWVSIRIIAYLNSMGEKADLFNNRIYVKGKIFSYLPIYKKISKETDGKVGVLYYAFYISLLLFSLLLIAGILLVSS